MVMANPIAQAETALSPTEIPAQVDLIISLHLHLWPALTITIQNGWGTSNPQIGEDKRDWLAGAVSDLFAQNQLRDIEDLEDVLEQVMNDEFEVVIDDGSLEEVSHRIWRGVEKVRKGDGSEVQALMKVWDERKKKGSKPMNVVRGEDDNNEDDSSGDEDEEENEEQRNGMQVLSSLDGDAMDIDTYGAPAASSDRKADPEVDEDGFTKVVSKKKR